MSILSIQQKTLLDKPLTLGVPPWLDPSPSAALSRLDAALYLSRFTPISLPGGDPESGALQKVSTLVNGGIGEGGSLNNTDIRGAHTARELPLKPGALGLSFSGGRADGMDVLGGGAITDADLASETHYKEHCDTSYPYDKYVDSSSDEPSGLSSAEFYESLLPDCAKVFSVGECENCHRFTKVHMCGKEWCLDCGEKDSWIHNRRFSRWLAKAQQMRDMGYYVIEWPVASRHKLHSKQAMADMGKRVKGAFQALGYDRGLRRWHFFGEYTDKFNPHINVLVESAYLSERRLEYIKSYLRLVLDEPDLIVNYSYRQTVAQKVHTLKYVTRATFLDLSWDFWLASDLYNFQNTNYWGKWKDDPVWEMSRGQDGVKAKALESLESGKCPICGTSIRWDIYCVMHIAWLKIWQAAGKLKPVGGGYFELLDTG